MLTVSLRLAGATAVVFGGGQVAARKVQSLHSAGAWVRVVANSTTASLQQIWQEGGIEWCRRAWRTDDLDGTTLVVAATGEGSTDAEIALAANSRKLLVSVMGQPKLSTFFFTAQVTRGRVQVGISTGGYAPEVAAHLRELVEALLGPSHAELTEMIGEVNQERRHSDRPLLPEPTRASRYRQVVVTRALSLLERGDREMAGRVVRTLSRL